MKIYTSLVLLLTTSVVCANPYGGVDMQKMMENMQAMQSCMEKIDQPALERLHQKGKQVEAEIRQHCRSGDTAAAQDRGMAFAREVKDSKALAQMQQCAAMMRDIMPAQMQAMLEDFKNRDHAGSDICSQI